MLRKSCVCADPLDFCPWVLPRGKKQAAKESFSPKGEREAKAVLASF